MYLCDDLNKGNLIIILIIYDMHKYYIYIYRQGVPAKIQLRKRSIKTPNVAVYV